MSKYKIKINYTKAGDTYNVGDYWENNKGLGWIVNVWPLLKLKDKELVLVKFKDNPKYL